MTRVQQRPRGYPRALCLCGCGRFVKHHYNKYATVQCVPRSVRSQGAKKGRRTFAYRRRAILFRSAVQRMLTRDSRRVSNEDLLAVLMDVYKTGYTNGYHAAQFKARQQTAVSA